MFYLNTRQMYKVFFNESLILLNPENKNLRSGNIVENIEIEDVSVFFDFLLGIDSRKYVEEPVFNCLAEKDLVENLILSMNRIPAAGGIVRNLSGKILFIKRFGRWDLPKGKVEADENLQDAAIREVEEECGISNLQILRKIPSTFHIYRSPFIPEPNNWVWKETSWFEMRYSGQDNGIPQLDEDITEIRWFAPEEIDEVYDSTYGNLRLLLQGYLA